MEKNIEDFLRLDEEEIQRRKEELLKRIPTIPGIEYLKTRAKLFDVQPWPFIIYLAHYDPDLLTTGLNLYRNYDGNENVGTIMEQLRERYIIASLHRDIIKEESSSQDKK